jgi:hypothetical protein
LVSSEIPLLISLSLWGEGIVRGAFFLCGAVLAQEMLVVMLCWRITQESIGRPWRVKLKRDVNGLEGRVKPSV